MEISLRDIVLVHLAERSATVEADAAVPVAELCEVLGFEKRGLSGRVELLSTLDELTGAELVVEHGRADRGIAGEQRGYALTDRGRERAATIRDRVADRVVTVRDGDPVDVPLSAIDEHLPPPALARALARLGDDGVVRVAAPDERFVNRTADLDRLERVLDRVAGGDPASVLVAGAAGIGKTTLVSDEFADRAAAAGVRIVVETCSADRTEPYGPIGDAVERLGVTDLPLRSDADPDPSDAETYAAERSAMFEAVADGLTDAAADAPVALVVEDLHAAGEATLALFEALSTQLHGGVALIGTYRPEDLPADHPLDRLAEAWDDDAHADAEARSVDRVHRTLSSFSRADTRRLIESVLGESEVPAAFVDILYEHTGGNPLFVEESVSRAVSEGIVDPAYDVYPEERSALPLPESVEAAIGLRVGAVDDATERMLEVAALIGQEVPTDVLAAALDLDADAVDRRLDLLVDARVLERADEETLRFASGLVRETCVDRVPDERAAAHHRRIAEAYATVHEDDPDRHAAVARHRRAAGDHEAAFESYREAGERALELYAAEAAAEAFETAHAIHEEALDSPADDEDALALLDRLATTQMLQDDYAAADRYLRYVAERTTDDDRRRTVATRRARLWRERGDYERALDVVQSAIEAAGVDETAESADLVAFEGFLQGKRGEYDAAEDAYDRAVALAEAVGDDDLIERLRRSRAGVDLERGTVDEETLSAFQAALETAREDDDEMSEGIALLNLGIAFAERGDYERAEARLRDCIDRFESVGVENHVCDARNTLGTVLASRCRWDDALDEYEQVLETARRLDNGRLQTYAHINTTELHETRGDVDRARECAAAGLAVAEELDNPHYCVETLLGLTRLALAADEPDTAAEHVERAATIAAEEVTEVLPRVCARHGDVARARGDDETALTHYDRGLDRRESVGEAAADAVLPLQTGAALAAVATGDHDRARAAADAALSAARDGLGADEQAPFVRAHTVAGVVARERGGHDDAGQHLGTALERARADGRRLGAWRANYELALVELALGDDQEATSRLRDVRDAAAEGGAERLVRRCEAALSES